MALRGEVVWLFLACTCSIVWVCTGQSAAADPSAGEYGDYDVQRSRLLEALLHAYTKHALPKMPVNTTYSLTITQIDGVDEKDNLLRISVWASTKWYDHRLVWNPDDFGGVISLTIDTEYLWMPDLRPTAQVLEAEKVLAVVMSDGLIYHVQPLKLAVYCPFDLTRYPYDTQHCNLQVMSWSHHMAQIDLATEVKGLDTSSYMAHTMWDLTDTSATRTATKYSCCVEMYVGLRFELTIRRRTGGYTARVVAPSVLTSLLVLVCFLVPPSRGERVVLAGALLLCLLVQLLYLNLTVPLSDTGSPYLAHFLCFGTFLAFFACLESVLVLNLSRGFWGDEVAGRQDAGGEFQVGMPKTSTPVARIARIIDVISFVVFTIIFAIVGGVILNPKSAE